MLLYNMIFIVDIGCNTENNYSGISKTTATNQPTSWIIKPAKHSKALGRLLDFSQVAWLFAHNTSSKDPSILLFQGFKNIHLSLSTVDTSFELGRISWRLQLGIGLCDSSRDLFDPQLEVTNNPWKGHLSIPKRAQRIAGYVAFLVRLFSLSNKLPAI